MTTSDLELVGPEQLRFAGGFEGVATDRGWWLGFPAGRHAAHRERAPEVALCLTVRDAGPGLDVLLAELRAVAPPEAQIVVVEGGSTDWSLARCLRAAAADDRVVVYQARAGASADALAVDALALAASPLVAWVPARGRVGEDLVTALREALERAPATMAAVAASVTADGALLPPWAGLGHVYGPDAAAGAISAPVSALLGRPALFRREALRVGTRASLRDVLVTSCGRADVVGVGAALALQPGPDEPDAPTRAVLAEAIAGAERVAAELPDRHVVTAAARAVAESLARLPEAGPGALDGAAGALRRLAAAAAAAPSPALDLRRFRPGLDPLALDVRAFSFLCGFGWDARPPDGLAEVVAAYVAAFAPSDPVSLVLRGELEDPAAGGELEAWLGGLITGPLGRALDDIPDVLVEIAPLPDELRTALYAAVDCAVALPGAQGRQWALEAMACGVPVVATDADAAGVVSSATGFPAGAGELAATLGAAAADPVETGRRGAAARAALVARAL